jgi:hypothetical protein
MFLIHYPVPKILDEVPEKFQKTEVFNGGLSAFAIGDSAFAQALPWQAANDTNLGR